MIQEKQEMLWFMQSLNEHFLKNARSAFRDETHFKISC
ncbi:hypothetical protein CEV33_3699 [Brucella grignonensis]|uniref:Uncharacterized protein n=1 Tax=Brucella grignonensis TaxID=94627 RepID=A0A256EYG9_9HYPH|nr:hypothetical protein CEV33_3699 [Brucella grignonensis]